MTKDTLLNENERKGFMKGLDYALRKIDESKDDYIKQNACTGIKGFDKIHKEIVNQAVSEITNQLFLDALFFHSEFENNTVAAGAWKNDNEIPVIKEPTEDETDLKRDDGEAEDDFLSLYQYVDKMF